MEHNLKRVKLVSCISSNFSVNPFRWHSTTEVFPSINHSFCTSACHLLTFKLPYLTSCKCFITQYRWAAIWLCICEHHHHNIHFSWATGCGRLIPYQPSIYGIGILRLNVPSCEHICLGRRILDRARTFEFVLPEIQFLHIWKYRYVFIDIWHATSCVLLLLFCKVQHGSSVTNSDFFFWQYPRWHYPPFGAGRFYWNTMGWT